MMEIKKCPFCGANAKFVQTYGNYGRVECGRKKCKASLGWYYGDKTEAIEHWNKRKGEE